MPGTYISPAETGLYYLQSRYYDPEIGRFINADGQFDEKSGLFGGNLFVYCANNPVKYIDSTGEGIFLTLAIGFAVGAIVSGIVKICNNCNTGRNWYDGLAIAMLAGGIGGAISCVPIPGVKLWVSAVICGAAGNVATKLILGEIKSISDLTSAIAQGAAAGLLGYGASKLLIKGVSKYFTSLTKAGQKAFLGRIGRITNRQLTAIRQEIKRGLTSKKLDDLVKKYGYDVIASAFVSSTATSSK